jgi:hypothetical protein
MARLNVVPRDGEDFGRDLLAAKERDLEPLLAESTSLLELNCDQATAMEDFLNLAWISGSRSGYDQMEARATQSDPDLTAIAHRRFESEFKALMEEAAERLELTVSETVGAWNLLQKAWLAGKSTSSNELMKLYVEVNSDVPEEARKWLEERGRGGDEDRDAP